MAEMPPSGFKFIPGYVNKYAISLNGDVYSCKRKRLLKPCLNEYHGYLYVSLGSKTHSIHRIMGMTFLGNRPKGSEINHKNGDKTDNRRSNLEYCDSFQNRHFSRPYTKSTSKYKGVCWSNYTNKWKVQIRENKRDHFIGYFKSEIEAAKAYDKYAEKFHKRHAWLNKKHFKEVANG